MQHRFVRADNSVLQKVKSVRYISQANDGDDLRLGSCIADSIEVTCYGSLSDAPAEGEVIKYYQIFDRDANLQPLQPSNYRQVLIGQFIAKSSFPSKNTYSFVAYDNISKLNVDFSSTLRSLKSSFPMTVADLLGHVATTAGVTIQFSNVSGIYVNYFYADGITCRDIVSAVAELLGSFVRCAVNGWITTGEYADATESGWLESDLYIVAPTDQITYPDYFSRTLVPVVYKENGLTVSEYGAEMVDKLVLRKSDGTAVGEYAPYYTPLGMDVYEISNNIILDNTTDSSLATWVQYLSNTYNKIRRALEDDNGSGLKTHNAEAHLFPFLNPLAVGRCAQLVAPDGTRCHFPVMKMVVDDSEAVLYSFTTGHLPTSSQHYQTADEANLTLSARVNKLEDTVSQPLSSQFELQDVTVFNAEEITAGSFAENTVTATKTGYYPLGIVGTTASGSGSTYALLLRATLTARSSGSASVYMAVRNGHASNNISALTEKATILWVANTGQL